MSDSGAKRQYRTQVQNGVWQPIPVDSITTVISVGTPPPAFYYSDGGPPRGLPGVVADAYFYTASGYAVFPHAGIWYVYIAGAGNTQYDIFPYSLPGSDSAAAAAATYYISTTLNGAPADITKIGGTTQTGLDLTALFSSIWGSRTPAGSVQAVGVVSAAVVAANANRRTLYIKNTSTAGQRIGIAWGATAAVIDTGRVYEVGEGDNWDKSSGIPVTALNAIASAAGAQLSIEEA